MEGELEPANVLIDRFIQMADDGIVEWVPWEECPKRDQELRSARGKKRWMADASGIVKEKETPKDVTTDTSSVIRIQWAMRRRGLALDVAGLMSYEAHDLLVDKLVGAVTGEAIDSRYAVPSLQQAHSADKEVWRQLQKATRVGLRGAPIGAPRPLDEPLKGVLVSAELCFILLPLPSVTATKPAASKGASADPEVGRLRKEVQELKKKLASASGSGGGGGSGSGSGGNGSAKGKGRGNGKGGGGNGKGAGKSRPVNFKMPAGLEGCVTVDDKGNRLCFNFNLGRCGSAGSQCKKGVHACCKPGCFGPHPAIECSA